MLNLSSISFWDITEDFSMICKHCQTEIPDELTVCPNCAALLSDPESAANLPKKRKALKIVLASVGCFLLALCLSVVVYWGVIGVTDFEEGIAAIGKLVLPRENNVYRKDSYSVSDEKAAKTADRVVAAIGEEATLHNGLLQIYYWMDVYDFLENYSYYAVYYGLDYTQPLDQQSCRDNDGNWQQYFLEKAINKWHGYQALSLLAQQEGYELDDALQSQLSGLRESMTQSVLEEGHTGLDALIQSDMGPGCTYDDYESYMNIYYYGYSYLTDRIDKMEITDADIEAYFASHSSELKEDGVTKESGTLKDIRHILIAVEGGTEEEDGDITYSEEEWNTCKAEAQALLDQWLSGEATEESFAELAAAHSEDTGSNTNGGAYTSLDEKSGFVQEFIDWYMDENRQAGDYGLLKTDYGYHVMYFSGSEAEWIRTSREGVISERMEQIITEAVKTYPMEVDYKKIALGVVNFGE